jgi:nucleotide-binding universal stress UspA family protein
MYNSVVTELSYKQALQDFRRARQEAAMRQLLHRITGEFDDLLAYHEVTDQLEVTATVEHGVREIPLDAIVGSVGRSEDFTREFLPKRDSDAERWARVKSAVTDMKGWNPIDVYQVGEAYFVKDGNHRVSVSRQLGNKTISARVTEVKTRLPIGVDADPVEIICRTNYIRFLEMSCLAESRPDADLYLTFCEQYKSLLAQIDAYRKSLSAQKGLEIAYEEAAARWYDELYLPVISLIRAQGTMRNFEDRTEADIYLLLSERREELEAGIGWEVSPRSAIADLTAKRDNRLGRALSRLGEKLLDVVAPALEKGPPPGQWRRQMGASQRDNALFADILVSLQGTQADWNLLDETIRVAQRENGRIMAIHAVDNKAGLESDETYQIRDTFLDRCDEAGIKGQFAAEVGVEGELMIERAAWVDLMATNLTFATDTTAENGLSAGVKTLIKRCPRPILVLAGDPHSPMDRALLAYDGSPKADEALFVATYLALRWNTRLAVVTVRTEYTSPAALERARLYLAGHQLTNIDFLLREEPITEAIIETAESVGSNLLIMGGFGIREMRHLMLGSSVEGALRLSRQPILICR